MLVKVVMKEALEANRVEVAKAVNMKMSVTVKVIGSVLVVTVVSYFCSVLVSCCTTWTVVESRHVEVSVVSLVIV